MRVAKRFLGDNLNRDIYVDEVARLVRVSRSRFSHLFKTEVGVSFPRYLKHARLEKARELLGTTFEPVKVIAFEVGYKDPAYFEREFKKAYGVTPCQYRSNHRAEIPVQVTL